MKTLAGILIIAIISLMAISGCKDETVSPTESEKYQVFRAEMRVLWSDHAIWTRNVIINIVDGAPGTTEAVNRLLKNQEDIGDAIKPYYGNAAGDTLTVLLKEHITIAAGLVTAAESGNTTEYNALFTGWYTNGDEIAAFLNAANPGNWPLAHMKAMMKEHLDLTLEEVVARITGNYEADVAAYDKVFAALMDMSDMISEGIALQFPDKF